MSEVMPVISKSVEKRLSAQVPEFAEVVRQRDAKEELLLCVGDALAEALGMCARDEDRPESLADYVRILAEGVESAEADANRLAAALTEFVDDATACIHPHCPIIDGYGQWCCYIGAGQEALRAHKGLSQV